MKDKVALGGSIVAAIAASLCCIGPLIALLLGLGTFGAAAAFEALRPYLLGLTALLLASAFYLVYRKREVKCEDGRCAQAASGRTKMMLWIATGVVITFAAFPYYSAGLLKADTQNSEISTRHDASRDIANPSEAAVVIMVSGMTCGSCAMTVRLALNKINGVNSAEVSLEKNEAKVTYDPSLVTTDQLEAAIDATGFKATEVKH